MGRRFDQIDIVLISLIGAYLFILAIIGLVFLLKLVDKHEEKKNKNIPKVKELPQNPIPTPTIPAKITTFKPSKETKIDNKDKEIKAIPTKETKNQKLLPYKNKTALEKDKDTVTKNKPTTGKKKTEQTKQKTASKSSKKTNTTSKAKTNKSTNTKKKTSKNTTKTTNTSKKNNATNRSNGYVSPTKRKKKNNKKRK